MPDRYDPNEPQTLTFDPEHPDLGWTYAEPLPFYDERPRWLHWLKRMASPEPEETKP